MIDIETSRTFTFEAFNKECNRYANFFQRRRARPKGIITTRLLEPALYETITDKLLDCDGADLYVIGKSGDNSRFIYLTEKLNAQRTVEPRRLDKVNFKSIWCYIYTSGTTGLPKAAVMKHFRYYSMVVGAAKSFGIYPSDRIYVSMPIYHTAAGI
ncbi:hypothetical protein OSTOST_21610, partial [Ostertagia ostertagi]